MKEKSAETVLSNFTWRLFERFGASGVTFVVSVILARLIDPEAYGLVAIVSVITSFVQVFVDGGLGTALVQKINADDIDFSTVFLFNLVFSLIVYLLLFFAAPFMASFYDRDELCPLIRVLCVVVIISAVKSIQQSYVTKHLLFKRFFFSTLGGTIAAAIIGIWMAYKGYGVWALVFQNVVNQTIDTAILWITVRWRPKLKFSWKRLNYLFSYGIKIFGANLIASIYNDIRQLAIGKVYTTSDLAYYNQGYKYPYFVMNNVNSSIDSVLFPVMVNAYGRGSSVKFLVKKSAVVESFIMFPLLIGLCACAPSLLPALVGEKWNTSIPYLQIFCLTLLINSLHIPHFNSLKAIGRSDLIFKVEFFKKTIDLVIVIGTLYFGVFAIALGSIAEGIISYMSTALVNGKTMEYPFGEQFADIAPNLFITLLMGGIVFGENYLPFGNIITSIIQIITGMIVYFICSFIFKPPAYTYVKQLVFGTIRRGSS